MPFQPPVKILITSDDNEIEFVKKISKSKLVAQDLYVYKFIKSETKMDMTVEFTEDNLIKNLSNNFKIM